MDPVGTRDPADVGPALDALYHQRFDERDHEAKERIWPAIVEYLQRFVDAEAPVMDVACDRGYFIRHVRARERWASDVRDVGDDLGPDIRFVQADGLEISSAAPRGHFGTVFMSNYLEHLADSHAVIRQLREARHLLRPGGRLIVLQPNVRFVGPRYWDFIDHHVPLTENSLVEAGHLAGLQPVRVIPRFLPYSTKGRLPVRAALVRAYLRVPLAWRLLGRQTLYVAERAT